MLEVTLMLQGMQRNDRTLSDGKWKLIHVDVSVHQIINLSYAHIEMNEEMFETSMVVAIKSLAVDVQFAIYELGLLLSFYRTLQTFV